MLLALAILGLVVIVAALIAKFVLHLDFKSVEIPENDQPSPSCYENWAAHRACPQGLPTRDSRD